LSLQQKKTEERVRKVDPKKANEVERLGMGVASKVNISHDALTGMSAIKQVIKSWRGIKWLHLCVGGAQVFLSHAQEYQEQHFPLR